jgi:hypothetical protein
VGDALVQERRLGQLSGVLGHSSPSPRWPKRATDPKVVEASGGLDATRFLGSSGAHDDRARQHHHHQA